jgi:hypothetical protein
MLRLSIAQHHHVQECRLRLVSRRFIILVWNCIPALLALAATHILVSQFSSLNSIQTPEVLPPQFHNLMALSLRLLVHAVPLAVRIRARPEVPARR